MGWDEERLVVLKMLRDGRLEPEEAVRLLRAIDKAEAVGQPAAGMGAPGAEDPSRGDPSADDQSARGPSAGESSSGDATSDDPSRGEVWGRWPQREEWEAFFDRLGERLESVRERVEEAVRSARERAERGAASGLDELDKAWESIQRTVGQVVSEIPQRLGRSAGSFFKMEWDPQRRRPVQTTERPLVLQALETGSSVEIVTRNGSVTVEGTDGPATASVKMWLRAETPEEAQERAETLVQAEGNGRRWWLKTAEERGETVEIRLALPRSLEASLQASTVNGRLTVRDVALGSLHLRTENGEVEVTRVRSGRSQVETVNGGLTLEGLVGEQAEGSTVNGSLRARVDVRDGRFRTLNGLLEMEPLVDEGAEEPAEAADAGPAPSAAGLDPSAGGVASEDATESTREDVSSMADSPADPGSFSTSPGDAEGRAEPSGRSGGEQQDLEPERRYDLESTNGRVRVAVAARPGVGYRFQLYSVEGRISLGLDDISHVVNQVSEPGGSIQVESFNYQQQPRRVAVQVRSLNGPIQVESGTL